VVGGGGGVGVGDADGVDGVVSVGKEVSVLGTSVVAIGDLLDDVTDVDEDAEHATRIKATMLKDRKRFR
jgi:hypothetical protein